MEPKGIDKKIRSILGRHLKKRGLRLKIDNTMSLIGRGIIDSLGALELITALEKEFKIKVLSEEMTEVNFDTIEKIKEFVKTKLRG